MQEFWVYMYFKNEYIKCAKLAVVNDGYELLYESDYLALNDAIAIDPQNLPLYSQKFKSVDLFTAIADSAPDYWGKELLNRKFTAQELPELEYVLANGLEHVGALAYSPIEYEVPMKLSPSGWTPHKKNNVELEQIMEQTELLIKEADRDKLKELFEYGPTLGGGRPKLSLVGKDKMYLAKYATSLDSSPEQKIEYATMKMATNLGFKIPKIKITKHLNRDVFMIERFDRKIKDGKIEREHFISVLSLCAWHEFGKSDWSYPVFCDFLRKVGSKETEIKEDLEELFKRVAFNIAVNNNDDHPRNHGILFKEGKWRLSPLYDVVPKAIRGETFTTAMSIGIYGTEASRRNLLSATKYFEVDDEKAEAIVDEVNTFVRKNWKSYFKDSGIKDEIISQFENAMRTK